ncbi:MAG: hypothetical protein HYV07_06970 [Deltaproteobacteria bacterium]|nr:hypothetical protein [Deltaproteobacteria bacterium]
MTRLETPSSAGGKVGVFPLDANARWTAGSRGNAGFLKRSPAEDRRSLLAELAYLAA